MGCPWSNQTIAIPSIFGRQWILIQKGWPPTHTTFSSCLFNVQLWWLPRDLVELVELPPRRVPLHDLLRPLSMDPTTPTSSLSALTRLAFQKPVFSRQEKSSAPSSGCSNVGLSSGTDSTVSEMDEDEDTIVRWGWVWYKGEMRRISELPPAPVEPPKPSPPKRKVGFTHHQGLFTNTDLSHSQYDFKPVFSLPPSPRQNNDTVEVASAEEYCDQHNPDRISQTVHRFHHLDINSPTTSPTYTRKPSFISKPLIEASNDDIFDDDSDMDCDFGFEADFADDELEDEDEEDDEYDTLDPNSITRYICDFLDPIDYSDDEDFE